VRFGRLVKGQSNKGVFKLDSATAVVRRGLNDISQDRGR
jgi:hypothetical protein